MEIKSNDFYIIKIRTITSKYYFEKYLKHESVGLQKQYEVFDKYHKFFWSFSEYLNGKTRDYYFSNFPYSPRECAEEEIYESHGIMIYEGGYHKEYLIPKLNNEHIFNWVSKNLPLKFKVKKRTRYFLNKYWSNTTFRDRYQLPLKNE